MKILVPIKRVVDYNVKVRPKADESGVDLNNVKMAINPFCEIAVEEAVRLKEGGTATEIIAVTVGSSVSQEQLRTALALGADRALLVKTDTTLQPLDVAKALTKVYEKEAADLVIMGKVGIDGDHNQTGQMFAALTNLPQATFASKPCIVSTDLRLNEPRYASLPNIMKAKQKPLDVIEAGSLGVDIEPRNKTLKVSPPPVREAGIIVETVDDLVDKLKNEAKVIT